MPRELGADPSDFDIAADGSIEIQPFETLGHYAAWLRLPASQLRQRNGLRQGSALVVGRRLELDLSRVDEATFEAQRRDYHRSLQEAFFSRYHITGSVEHRVSAGDSLWRLTRRYPGVPIWLMRQYNPDLDFTALRPGTSVLVPVLERAVDQTDGTAPADCFC
jgi:membrane-bound lytic murein transglycosylase D